MKASERLTEIRKLIAEKPFVSQKELEALFPFVTSMTVRRDIMTLESKREVIRVRGGIRGTKFIDSSDEDSFFIRLNENMPAKERIADAALYFVKERKSLFIDAGTTTGQFAKRFEGRRVSVITTSPTVAVELSRINGPTITLVGGMLNRENLSITGAQAVDFLYSVNIDIAFLAAAGFSPESGFTCGNYYDCEIKKYVASKARQVIMLMDSSKFGKVHPYTFCTPKDVDILITNGAIPDQTNEMFRAENVQTVHAM